MYISNIPFSEVKSCCQRNIVILNERINVYRHPSTKNKLAIGCYIKFSIKLNNVFQGYCRAGAIPNNHNSILQGSYGKNNMLYLLYFFVCISRNDNCVNKKGRKEILY